MAKSCEDIQEEIGQSISGELSVRVHKHIKVCKECDNYAQKIIRLEKIYKEEGSFTEPAGQPSARLLKWVAMSVGACIILLLPDTYKIDLGFESQPEMLKTKYTASRDTSISPKILEDQLNQYISNWSQVEEDFWEQIGEEGWYFDDYSKSMEVISQWQIDNLDVEES